MQPRNTAFKNRVNLPERVYTLWLKESAEYIKFVNPGDLRVAAETCGRIGCHAAEVRAVSRKSRCSESSCVLMTRGSSRMDPTFLRGLSEP